MATMGRPVGKSLASDLATAGAGFAVGLKKEQQRKKDEVLSAAMREFEQDVQRQQLGFSARQVGLAESQGRLQQDEFAANKAFREVQERRASEQLGLQKQEVEDNRQRAREQREISYAQMANEERLLEMRLRSEERQKQWEVASRSNTDHASLLNTMADNLRQELRDFRTNNIQLLGAFMNPNIEEQWRAELQQAPAGSAQARQLQENLLRLREYDDLQGRMKSVGDKMYDNAVRAGALSQASGTAAPSEPVVERRWRDYTPEEKASQLQRIGAALNQQPDIDIQPMLDLGISRREITDAKRATASIEQSAAPNAPPAPITVGQSVGPNAFERIGAVLNPQPSNSGYAGPMGDAPSFAPPKVDPTAAMKKMQNEQARIISAPQAPAPARRAPILGGPPPALDSGPPWVRDFAKRQRFMNDKNPSKHRIRN